MAAAVMSSSRGGRGSAYRPMHYGYGNSDNEPGGMAQSLMALIGLFMAGSGIYLLITSALHPREVLPPRPVLTNSIHPDRLSRRSVRPAVSRLR